VENFMRYSNLFPKTLRTAPADMKLISHKLLYRGGFIRESAAGRYYFLPLGWRVHQNIQRIIKEEMDRSGAQELLTPLLHPKRLWEETNRTTSVGFELMTVKDRSEAAFVLGGTGEEMLVDLVRKFQLCYKDLPFNLYQFSTKFRDEARARGGLMRLREFVMKDAYSFHDSEEDFKKEYEKMIGVYTRIFDRLGLSTIIVESDNGYIGGEYCHEFVVENEAGESKFLMTEDGSYAAHEDVARFAVESLHDNDDEKPIKEIEGKGIIGVEELAKYLDIPIWKTTKTILFEDESGNVIAAAIRGGYDINEVKLMRAAEVYSLKLASAETVKRITGATVGYAGLLSLPKDVRIFMDVSMVGRRNFEMGANKTNFHSINVNFGRDLPEPGRFYDIGLAKAGYISPNGAKLVEKRGIEVGNIFQLGFHYSSKMKGATYTDADGKKQPYYMGCYGIGVARTLATVVENFHDDKGVMWPEAVSPYRVHLVGLDLNESEVRDEAEGLYRRLEDNGVEVLFDDRDERAGEKFADADLLGIPLRVVVSARSLASGGIECKSRNDDSGYIVSVGEFVSRFNS
jgi:prolyl-tRNA synthetase